MTSKSTVITRGWAVLQQYDLTESQMNVMVTSLRLEGGRVSSCGTMVTRFMQKTLDILTRAGYIEKQYVINAEEKRRKVSQLAESLIHTAYQLVPTSDPFAADEVGRPVWRVVLSHLKLAEAKYKELENVCIRVTTSGRVAAEAYIAATSGDAE